MHDVGVLGRFQTVIVGVDEDHLMTGVNQSIGKAMSDNLTPSGATVASLWVANVLVAYDDSHGRT